MKVTTDQIVKMRKYLFREGCCLVEAKSTDLHPELQIPNDQVMKFMRKCLSRAMVTKVFVWRHAYFFLTDIGVKILRDELCYDDEDFPLTHIEDIYDNMMIGEKEMI
ncbi:40S ribosomal protein S10b [Dictyocoela muelleri]|nr:40S ribosomal protein S10b [Dictyocoela muelleri]